MSQDNDQNGLMERIHSTYGRALKQIDDRDTGFHTLSQDRGTPSRICLSQSQDCGMMLEIVDDT